MKKRILSLALALVMVLITIVIPSSVTVSARGNGYSPVSFKHNDKYYAGSLTTHYDPAEGGWTSFNTLAAINVKLDGPVVKYNTISHGYCTYTGRSVTRTLTEKIHTVSTEAVPCKYGMSQVVKCEYVYAYVTVYADSIVTASATGHP